jgi:hypothetical protein
MQKSEKELVIRFDAAERVVYLYTCFPKDWRRAEQKGHTPAKRHVRDGREIARQYRIPLDCFHYGFRALNRPRRAAPTWLWKRKIRQQQKPNVARRPKKTEAIGVGSRS